MFQMAMIEDEDIEKKSIFKLSEAQTLYLTYLFSRPQPPSFPPSLHLLPLQGPVPCDRHTCMVPRHRVYFPALSLNFVQKSIYNLFILKFHL